MELKHIAWLDARAWRDLKGIFHRGLGVIYPPGGLAESDRLDGLIDAVNAHVRAYKNQVNVAAHEKHPNAPVARPGEIKQERLHITEHKALCKMQVTVSMLCLVHQNAVLLDLDAALKPMGMRRVMHKKGKPEQIYKPYRKIFNQPKAKLWQ